MPGILHKSIVGPVGTLINQLPVYSSLLHPAPQFIVTYLSPVLMHLDYTDEISVYMITA